MIDQEEEERQRGKDALIIGVFIIAILLTLFA